MNKFLLFALLGGSAVVCAQTNRFPPINLIASDPTGNVCSGNLIQQSSTTGLLYTCQGGTMHTGGATGNITASPQFSLFYQPSSGTTAAAQGDSNIITDGAGHMKALTVTSSINKIISVIAPPYNAKCDGATDDQTAIQAAFTAALSGGQSVQFPAGTCLTSTITWKGQPFFGAGLGQTFIKGMPGFDVFHTTDGNATDFVQNPVVRDLTIQVDASVDASATAAGGNNRYPNRTFLVSTGTTPITPAIGASPFTWGDNYGCNDALNDGINSLNLTTLYLNCGAFTSVPTNLVVGQPLHINGAGPSIAGGAYSVTNGILTMTLANAYSAGNQVTFLGFSGGLAGVKNWTFPVLAAGLSGSQFEVNTGTLLNNGSGTDASGTISLPVDATILTVVDAFHVTFTPAGVTNLAFGPNQGTYGPAAGNAPPGYCGAAGFAFPTTDGTLYNHNTNGITFRNVYITAVNSSVPGYGHTCGIYAQQQLAGLNVDHLFTRQLYGGYIESLPYNNSVSVEYTPDESHGIYQNHSGDFFPLVLVNGTRRNYGQIIIHDLQIPFAYGALFTVLPSLNPTDNLTAKIDTIYYDCYGHNLGETNRYMGQVNISTGTLNNCGNGYTGWYASDSTVGAAVNASVHIEGNRNNFTYATFSGNSTVQDDGLLNGTVTPSVSTNPFQKRAFYSNSIPYQDPIGKLDGSSLISPNSTPFLNASDLLITCRDHRQWTGGSLIQVCTNDPTGTEVTKSYLDATTDGTGVAFGTGFVSGNNQQFIFGSRVPLTKVNFITIGQCDSGAPPCTATITFRDLTTLTNVGTCNVSWGNAWTTNGAIGSATVCQVDFSAIPAGDVFTFNSGYFTGSPTHVKVAMIGIQPYNPTLDTAGKVVATALPNPGASSLGGVQSKDCSATGHLQKINTDGTVTCSADSAPQVPANLLYLGDGSDSALTVSSGVTNITGEHWYTNVTIAAGATLSYQSGSSFAPLVIRATGTCTIAGTISLSVNDAGTTFGGIVGVANGGGTGGGGGFGAVNGAAGSANSLVGPGAAGTSGNPGGNGNPVTAIHQKYFMNGFLPTIQATSSLLLFGGTAGGIGGSSGGAAGKGGGALWLVCGTLNFTGTIDAGGSNGGAGGANTGGGGGGGGGFVVVRTPSVTANSGTITVTGGTGGAIGSGTSTKGGDGAAGWSKVFTQ